MHSCKFNRIESIIRGFLRILKCVRIEVYRIASVKILRDKGEEEICNTN